MTRCKNVTWPSLRVPFTIAGRIAVVASVSLLFVTLIPSDAALSQAIPAGANLNSQAAPNGGSWNLTGDDYLSNGVSALVAKTLPANFAINGAPSGSLITLNDGGGHYGRFSVPAGAVLGLSNVTVAGGSAASGGAMVFATGSLLNVSGAVTFAANTATATDGGAINAPGSLTINGSSAALNLIGNSSPRFGGAIQTGSLTVGGSFSNILIDGNVGGAIFGTSGITFDTQTSGSLAITNNTGTSTGGGLRAGADGLWIRGSYGNVLIDRNHASGPFGGGFAVSTPGSIGINATIGTLSISNNTSTRAGALGSGGNITIDGTYGRMEILGNAAESGGAMNAPGVIAIGSVAPTSIGALDIIGNTVTGSGGAFAPGAGIAIVPDTVGNIIIVSNQAGVNGGAFTANGPITISNSNPVGAASDLIIRSNTAGRNGGAILGNSVGGISLLGNYNQVAISDNVANTHGGAFFALGAITIGGGATTAANLAITGNSATTGNGGAFYVGNSILLSGNYGSVAVAGNAAQIHGGALFSLGSITLAPISGSFFMGGNVATTGSGGAAYAVSDFTLVAGGRSEIIGNVSGVKGGAIWAGGNTILSAKAGDIVFAGNRQADGPNALFLNNSGGGKTAVFDAAEGRAIFFFDPVETNAANGLLSISKTGAGMASFDGFLHADPAAQWSRIYGSTTLSEGIFEISNQAVYGVLASDVGGAAPTSFATLAGTTLQGGGIGTLRADTVVLGGDLSIAGRQGDVRSVFNIVSNGLVLNGGNVLFNTYLNDGRIQNSDILALNLNGTATAGTANIVVNNVGGLGAITVGNGIELVQTTSGTTHGAFRLGAPVVAGPYEYTLHRGSVDGSAPENWYLRNTWTPDPGPDPFPGPDPNPTPDPDPVPVPSGLQLPDYRREVSLYTALPAMGLIYGRTIMDTLHERVGELRTPLATGAANDAASYASSAWGRIIGQYGRQGGDPAGIYGSGGPAYTYDVYAMQIGLDLYRSERADGSRDIAGMYGAIGQIQGEVTHYTGFTAGTNTIDGYSLGLYWTHFGPSGWYLDAILQGTWFDATADSGRLITLHRDGLGWGASLEGGYPFGLGDGWSIEPQAQLVYQTLAGGSGGGPAAIVRFGDVESLAGRVGARLVRTWPLEGDALRLISAWARLSLWHEFRGDPVTEFSSADGFIPFHADLSGSWAELNLGVDTSVTANLRLYANAGYQLGWDTDATAYSGKIGLKFSW